MNTNPFDTLPKLKPGLAWWLPAGMSPEEAAQKLGGKYRPLIHTPGLSGKSVPHDALAWCPDCGGVHAPLEDPREYLFRFGPPLDLYCTAAPVPASELAVPDKRQPGAWAEIRSDSTDPTPEILRPIVRLIEPDGRPDGVRQFWETSEGFWWVHEANILRNPENISTLPEGYRLITEAEFAQPAENWPEVALHSKSFGWMTDSPVRAELKQRPHWSIIVKRDAKFGAPPAPKPAEFPLLPAGVEWVNPEKYSPEQIGVADGWRPLCSRDVRVPDDVEMHRAQWGTFQSPECWRGSAWRGNSVAEMPTNVTYRTRAPIPSSPAPAPKWHNPENISESLLGAGYRFLTVEEAAAETTPPATEWWAFSSKEWRPRKENRATKKALACNTYRVKIAPEPAPPTARAENSTPEFSGWHNPENVDPKLIPVGYRFATVAESKGLLPTDNGILSDMGPQIRFVVGLDDEPEPFEDSWTYVVPVSWNLK